MVPTPPAGANTVPGLRAVIMEAVDACATLTGVLRDVLAAPAGAWPADVQPSDPQPRRATGETIRAARTTLGWTQADLATRMRKSRSAVAQWELGHAHPTAASLNELAALLGLQASDLLPPIT